MQMTEEEYKDVYRIYSGDCMKWNDRTEQWVQYYYLEKKNEHNVLANLSGIIVGTFLSVVLIFMNVGESLVEKTFYSIMIIGVIAFVTYLSDATKKVVWTSAGHGSFSSVDACKRYVEGVDGILIDTDTEDNNDDR